MSVDRFYRTMFSSYWNDDPRAVDFPDEVFCYHEGSGAGQALSMTAMVASVVGIVCGTFMLLLSATSLPVAFGACGRCAKRTFCAVGDEEEGDKGKKNEEEGEPLKA